MAGLLGFEPRYAGIKIQCLTAWRQPYCFHIKTNFKLLAIVTVFVAKAI